MDISETTTNPAAVERAERKRRWEERRRYLLEVEGIYHEDPQTYPELEQLHTNGDARV